MNIYCLKVVVGDNEQLFMLSSFECALNCLLHLKANRFNGADCRFIANKEDRWATYNCGNISISIDAYELDEDIVVCF
jgi:hypothetical protein